MRLRVLLAGLISLLFIAASVRAQVAGDVLGMHNLGPGTKSPVKGARPDSCAYCHAPHSGMSIGLWNQKLTTQPYTIYKTNTEKNVGIQPVLGSTSNKCLSCHDGTVAVGSTVAYGQVTISGSMNSLDVFSSKMQSSHPFSLAPPLKDNVHLQATLAANGKTADPTGAVKLVNGSVECTSCHNPHVQAKDLVSQNFLVKDSSGGQLCLACHDPSRSVSGQLNPLTDWGTSAHATSANKITSKPEVLGSYTTVATDACISCHAPHNAGSGARLLRGQDEQACISCHNGSTNVAMDQHTDVFAEYAKPKVGHPFPSSTNPHDSTENTLLDNNRHATCADCHNGHASQPVQIFPSAPLIRVSQKNVAGINASDGTSALAPAVNQYESCLRCHGASAGKQVLPIYGYFPVRAVSAGDPLNLISQFAGPAGSSHPVMQSGSGTPPPSLLANMVNFDGHTAGRAMGQQILCTDCHNSDDNRESGGPGANGPHGSVWKHILERRYEFSQAPSPGQLITVNLNPTPDLGVTGPYALCGKCHNLQVVVNQNGNNSSWSGHTNHVWTDGFSCSTCHTAHGNGTVSSPIANSGLVNFDMNVVAPNVGPITFTHSGTNNTCVLVCHGHAHGGSTPAAMPRRGPIAMK